MSHTFLVTGASKGIGLALSHRLHQSGHRVIGIARAVPTNFPGRFVSADWGTARRRKPHSTRSRARSRLTAS